jgi:hypothetical protein
MEVRPMATQSRSAAEHYADAERLVRSVPENPNNAVALATVHALLAAAPRRARKTPAAPGRHVNGSPTERWLYGDDGGEQR